MKNIIRIKNATFYAYHGVLKEEQHIGGKFEADVEMHTDFSQAALTDDLQFTINYHDVYKTINRIVHHKKHYLIESLALEITNGLLEEFPMIKKIIVRIRKNSVPIGGVIDFVEAEIETDNV